MKGNGSKIFIVVVLLIGLSFVVHAYGDMTPAFQTEQNQVPYDVRTDVVEGWNLLAGLPELNAIPEESEIQKEDIVAVYTYVNELGKYVRVYPDPEEILGSVDDDQVISQSFWVYSSKQGSFEYRTEEILDMEARELNRGWNFVAVTPDFYDIGTDFTFDDIKGDCIVQGLYFFMYPNQEWLAFSSDEEFEDDFLSYGLLIKVQEDCSLGESASEGVGPPAIPPLGNSNSGLRKEIETYVYEEFSYETCELNPYQNAGFSSEQECKSAVRCLAEKFASIVPQADLEDLANDMEEDGGESEYISYLADHPDIMPQIEMHREICIQ